MLSDWRSPAQPELSPMPSSMCQSSPSADRLQATVNVWGPATTLPSLGLVVGLVNYLMPTSYGWSKKMDSRLYFRAYAAANPQGYQVSEVMLARARSMPTATLPATSATANCRRHLRPATQARTLVNWLEYASQPESCRSEASFSWRGGASRKKS